MTDFTERTWLTPDGLVLHARDYPPLGEPRGLPVICLHGLTRNARDFEALAPFVARLGRRVIVMDMRGRGRSAYDPNLAGYGLPTYMADVIGFAGALQVPRAVFVGTSMGGLITMGLAQAASDLVASMVLNDVGPEVSPGGLARILNQAGSGAPIQTWEDAGAYVRRLNETVYPGYRDEDWDRLVRRLFRDDQGRPVLDYDLGILQGLKGGEPQAAPDLWGLFEHVAEHRRVLVLRGQLSDILSAEVADRMEHTAPGIRACTVDGVGHAPDLSEPQAIDAIGAFLLSVD
jgi:pimeloyl-ACP methyl ester carboxylesterase